MLPSYDLQAIFYDLNISMSTPDHEQLQVRGVILQQPNTTNQNLFRLVHLVFGMFALYLSYRCNDGFSLWPFIAALIFPYLYIPWALAVPCRDLGLFGLT